uniref:Uncharacterized protein n=1 Tax=Arundo donax TaxID=35708 RepID=A0A0A9FM97_ARUDO
MNFLVNSANELS